MESERARDARLAALCREAERLADEAEREGDFDTAAYMAAVVTFLSDCMGTRVRRFRSRATPRSKGEVQNGHRGL
jgi:hypothetical protein